jgi:uncharacterized membrane protein (UPF0127 family)
MYLTSNRLILRNPDHTLGHYVAVACKTLLACAVFFVCTFSIPIGQFIAKHVFATSVERGVIGETAITLEILKTTAERQKGLSGRESIPEKHALLFIFEESDYHGIWMPNMKFSIDVVWLNEHNEVIDIARSVSPASYPKVFSPTKPARFVLEFNAGFAKKHSIKIGDRFTLL